MIRPGLFVASFRTPTDAKQLGLCLPAWYASVNGRRPASPTREKGIYMAPRSKCRTCGALVGAPVGGKCPPHQARGDRAKCPGSGQATVRM